MSTYDINRNISTTEVPPKDSKTELTDEELSKVTGGGKLMQTCCQGAHYNEVTLVAR
jgi:bacteriocin-like protein